MRISDWSSDVCSSDLERKRHCAMDVIAKIAVLALGEHPHAGARAAVGRRRLHAHRQRFDESVEAAGVLEIPAYPTVVQRLGAEIIAALRLLDTVVHE